MPNFYAPGIYVVEESTGANPIQPVGTSTAAFVGRAPDDKARLNTAFPVDNWTQFKDNYCKLDNPPSTYLANAVYGFFRNGGRRCYVVNIGASDSLTGKGNTKAGLDLLESVDEVALVAAPGFTSALAYESLLTHCEQMRDRFAILDSPETFDTVDALTKTALAPVPPPAGGTKDPALAGAAKDQGLRARESKDGYGAYYAPWITVSDALTSKLVNVPPSGHMAGIYARVDATRGVHKAPANETINEAVNVTYPISRAEQEMLNPNGVNCIRVFAREGVLVWGARTLAVTKGEWRYVNVRRLFNMVEESIANSTRWVVFEPNDRTLWKSIVRDVRAFLMMLWRDGALMGRSPEEAFFVQCDDETNPPESIDQGLVVTRIGIAPVKPAEFVVFRIGQSVGGTKVETEK